MKISFGQMEITQHLGDKLLFAVRLPFSLKKEDWIKQGWISAYKAFDMEHTITPIDLAEALENIAKQLKEFKPE